MSFWCLSYVKKITFDRDKLDPMVENVFSLDIVMIILDIISGMIKVRKLSNIEMSQSMKMLCTRSVRVDKSMKKDN